MCVLVSCSCGCACGRARFCACACMHLGIPGKEDEEVGHRDLVIFIESIGVPVGLQPGFRLERDSCSYLL